METPNHFSSSPRMLALELYTIAAYEANHHARTSPKSVAASEWDIIANALRPTELDN